MYLVWEMMILGSLPPGSSVASVADVMKTVGASKLVTWALNIFSLFAIVTSFLGVALGCVDFLNGKQTNHNVHNSIFRLRWIK